jgi:hypothetical protein
MARNCQLSREHHAMGDRHRLDINRRDFLRGGLAASAFALTRYLPGNAHALARGERVALITDPSDPIASAAPVQWATSDLQQALTDAGFAVQRRDRVTQLEAGERAILIAGSATPAAATALKQARVTIGEGAERLAVFTARLSGAGSGAASAPANQALHVYGTDARGLMYAVLDIADHLRRPGPEAASALTLAAPIVEAPSNAVRSVMRQFVSEPLDKPWLHDREMWPRYLSMLAANRFNRLHLAFGLAYDFLQGVTDSYTVFLYPFLLPVPGYNVRATNLPDSERDRNLEMLRYISDQTVAHGLTFQLGVWMHGYELKNSPKARYIIEGLTADTHAAYCRDALTAVLRACPSISAVALRIHGESGVAEGSYDFWQTVFEGVARCGRSVEIDLHAKGIDQTMIDRALGTGMPVNVSPKYWAEHLGLPYHQAAIRELEMPVAGKQGSTLMALSEGSRIFTRYGYADLLRADRKYTVRHRVWSGTQRLLLSGDPASLAAYSHAFQFCGSTGFEVMEPLTCRGRRGSGIEGTRRSGYLNEQFEGRGRWDWQKYEPWYRVWGRLTYNEHATIEADRLIPVLAHASRILPLVTTAHLPSAACDAYWPEMYWNQPIAAEPKPNPYGDTPAPKTFTHVSPLDPQLFSSISEHANELLKNERSGKYSPIEVATWLEDLAEGVTSDLTKNSHGKEAIPIAVAGAMIDAQIQADLGRFFAAKFRAGVLYAIYERTSDRKALDAALVSYRKAREAWVALADRARPIYAPDLSVSDRWSERGHWSDRLPLIDADIAQLAQSQLDGAKEPKDATALIAQALSRPTRKPAAATHTAPPRFERNAPLQLELTIARGSGRAGAGAMSAVWCCYRHVNQSERYERVQMEARANAYRVSIPAAYTDSPFALQYYFVLQESPTEVHLFPGLGTSLMQMPYFVVEQASDGRPGSPTRRSG